MWSVEGKKELLKGIQECIKQGETSRTLLHNQFCVPDTAHNLENSKYQKTLTAMAD